MARYGTHSNRNRNVDVPYLERLGARVRAARAARGMTRKILARDSGVSERYLAQLESGRGNVSVLILQRVADAMAMRADLLLVDDDLASGKRYEALDLLSRMSPFDVDEAIDFLRAKAGYSDKSMRIGLIGLRGAGKSTLGRILANKLGFPFIELNRLIEEDYGGSLDDLFSLAGQPAYRRYEARCLERVLDTNDRAVIATGGGIVANERAFGALIARSNTIWIKASPEEHMARVVAQGDMRPMADNREAMRDLRQILSAREELYDRAVAALDTTGEEVARSAHNLGVLARAILEKQLDAVET
ncbi:MAG: Shikimate kinase 2 [Alphaproteobacteria bacterium MarineAlpha4_Bin2]|nr:MAG: Shikimate kinase 2 [Alphaproteobacteria bacterium MarineAlpha4_Bin2]